MAAERRGHPGLGGGARRWLLTSLAGLRREKTRRGHLMCRWPEHQLRMLSHSTVRDGLGPSSRCRRMSCFSARTAVFSSICSSCRGHQRHGAALSLPGTPRHPPLTSPSAGSWSPKPTMRMQSAWRMQRTVHGVRVQSVW